MERGADQGKGVAREEAKAFSLCDQEEDSTGWPSACVIRRRTVQGNPGDGATLVALGGRLSVSSMAVEGGIRPQNVHHSEGGGK